MVSLAPFWRLHTNRFLTVAKAPGLYAAPWDSSRFRWNVSAIIYYKSLPNYIKCFGFAAINQIGCAQTINANTKTPVIISFRRQHLCGFWVIVLLLLLKNPRADKHLPEHTYNLCKQDRCGILIRCWGSMSFWRLFWEPFHYFSRICIFSMSTM